MAQAQLNPTPKDRFQNSDSNIKAHHDLLGQQVYQRAEDMALAHYARLLALHLGKSTNPQVDGMVNGWKLQGVHEYLSEFRNLAEKPSAPEPPGVNRAMNHGAQ